MSAHWNLSGQKHELPKSSGKSRVEVRPGGWILITDPETGTRHRIALHEGQGKLSALLGGTLYSGSVAEASRSTGAASHGEADLVAQFPGKVRKVLVKAGDVVEPGTVLILVEAMKMEFAVKASSRAKITRVLVKEGAPLSPGDRYFEMEELK